MKKTALWISVIVCIASCAKKSPGNPPKPTFFTVSGNIGANDNSTALTSDNNLLICGNPTYGSANVYFYKVAKSGNPVWSKTYSGANVSCSGIAELSTQEYFMCGSDQYDTWLYKTNPKGDLLWTRSYKGPGNESAGEIIKTADGRLLICGSTSNPLDQSQDVFLMKVSTDGDTLWTKTYPRAGIEVPLHLLQTQNGEYLVTGFSQVGGSNPTSAYMLKVDANGTKLWESESDASNYTAASAVELANGDLIACGSSFYGVLLLKTDHSGNKIWEKKLAQNVGGKGCSIKQSSDGTWSIIGYITQWVANSIAQSASYTLLLKIDQDGNQLALKQLFAYQAGGLNLIKDGNGDNIVTGNAVYVGGSSNGTIYMTRIDKDGNYK